jgi:cyclopropane fatty-acyl-phospholipid synthase-like methyltransferase
VQCGFIWNNRGPRGNTEEFYARQYRLRMHDADAKNVSFSAGSAAPLAQLVLDHFVAQGGLPARGHLLEVGAGKGEFLSRFVQIFPSWATTAIEPSVAAEILRARLPSTTVLPQPYQSAPVDDAFDAIVAHGVLEHVEDPVHLLAWMSKRLTDHGVILVVVPNFAKNPNDLFCPDHLSKLTEANLRYIADKAALRTLGISAIGITLVGLFGRGTGATRSPEPWLALSIAAQNEELAQQQMRAAAACRAVALRRHERFGFFGLGISGLFAPFFLGFDRSELRAYIDENPTMQGTFIEKTPVLGLEAIERLDIRHLALAISPIYVEQVERKLGRFNVTSYV